MQYRDKKFDHIYVGFRGDDDDDVNMKDVIGLLFRWIIPVVLISILNKSVCTSSTTNL